MQSNATPAWVLEQDTNSSFLQSFTGNHLFINQGQPPGGIISEYPTNRPSIPNIVNTNSKNGHATYFTVNETDGKGRKKHNIIRVRAVWMDDDNQRDEPLTQWPIRPSWVVQSSPGKYHYYWLTSSEHFDQAERVNQAIAQAYDGDTNSCDLSRFLRLPGYPNTKYSGAPLASVVDGKGKLYNWNDIVSAFPPITAEPSSESTSPPGVEKPARHRRLNEQVCIDAIRSGAASQITPNMNSLIASWAYTDSSSRIEEKIRDIFAAVPSDIMEQYRSRYIAALSQMPKFINSAKVKVNAKRLATAATESVAEWTGPTEFDEVTPLVAPRAPMYAEFEESLLPVALTSAAKAVAEWCGLDPTPMYLSGTSSTAAALNKSVIIHEDSEDMLNHFCSLGVVLVMGTGMTKSSIYKTMNKPFVDYSRRVVEKWKESAPHNKYTRKLLEKQLESFTKKLKNNSSPSEILSISRETEPFHRALANLPPEICPSVIADDITDEALVMQLERNNGRLAVFSPEGRKVLSNIIGRYSGQGFTGESTYISGITGDTIRRVRVGGNDAEIHDPCLNAFIMVQDDFIAEMTDGLSYLQSGLAARLPMFVYDVDPADMVSKQIDNARSSTSVDIGNLRGYYEALEKACVERHDKPLHVRLDASGYAVFIRAKEHFLELLKEAWEGQHKMTNKFGTMCLKYATVFAAIDDAGFQDKFSNLKAETYILNPKYINMGRSFVTALLNQSLHASEYVEGKSLPNIARSLFNVCLKRYKDGSLDEGFPIAKSMIGDKKRDHLNAAIAMLERHGWLKSKIFTGEVPRQLNGGYPTERAYPGSKVYFVNSIGVGKLLKNLENSVKNSIKGETK